MKKDIDAFEYAGTILNAMKKGILLTTQEDGKVNTMTIGWGALGIEWGKPIFIAYVRESRHTRQAMDNTGEFTVNVPLGQIDPRILGYCGTKSGRDTDKLRDLGLTLVPGKNVSVPGIKELPLTLECTVIYKQRQEEHRIPGELYRRYYPVTEDSPNADYHIAYYGQIVGAYIAE